MTDLEHQPPPPDGPVSAHARTAPTSEPADREAEGKGNEPEGKGNPLRLVVFALVTAALGVYGGWPTLVVVLGVVLMIFLHELGHFLAAKWSDMQVTEFFIGFGPRIWSFRRGETEYGLRVIPAGAYVKITGMSMLDEVPDDQLDRTYRVKSYPRRLLVAVAGSAMHFAQALVLLFVLFAIVGIPGGGLTEDRTWEVSQVLEGSAADDAGLATGDQILAIDGDDVESFQTMAEEIASRPGDDVVLTVERNGEALQVPVTIGTAAQDSDQGQLGIGRSLITSTVGPIEAVGLSFSEFGSQTTATLGFFTDFFSPSGISGFADRVAEGNQNPEPSPGSGGGTSEGSSNEGRIMSIIGAVQLGSDLTENGLLGFVAFFIAINITIGLINLAPMLPLDGGHVVIATYERVREFFTKGERYHVDMAKLMPLVYTVFLGLVLLGLSTMYLDIIDPV